MATLETASGSLTLRLTRAEKVGGLLRDLEVPLSAVTDVRVEADALAAVAGLRAPGLAVPGRRIGTWRRQRGHRCVVSVRRGVPAVRVALAGERVDELLVSLPDAAEVAARVRTAADAARRA